MFLTSEQSAQEPAGQGPAAQGTGTGSLAAPWQP